MNLLSNISLKPLHTFGAEVFADYFVEIQSISDLQQLIADGTLKAPHLFLGGGSNVLFTDNFKGLILKNCIKGKEVYQEDDQFVWINAASGEVWHDVVIWTVANGWGGLENLSLIPGTVGAAPMQNIGAYGVELTQVFESLEAVNIQTGQIEIFDHAACAFGYRESVFKHAAKGKYFIASVRLKLTKHPQVQVNYGAIQEVLKSNGIHNPTIQDVSDAVIHIRRSKLPDPKELGNAGSFFKNPEISADLFHKLQSKFPQIPGYPVSDGNIKVPAGWLIEQCGWKGKIVGKTGSHAKQALVLVNYGGATGKEILDLAKAISASVFEKFGIQINPEVNVV